MEGVKNAAIHSIPEAVGLHVRGIPNKYTWAEAAVNLWIVRLDEGEGAAPDFVEVGQGGEAASPHLIRGLSI